MPQPFTSYLDVLREQLATSLVARDTNARKVPLYLHRVLTLLLARERILPALQQKALAEFSALLDGLVAELGRIEGGMILTPQLIHHIRNQPDYEAAASRLQIAVRLLARQPSEPGQRLQRKLVAITTTIQEGLYKAAAEQDMKPLADASTGKALDAAQVQRLRDYLRNKFPDDAALEVGAITTIIGGGSKLTLVVNLSHTRTLPDAVVVRIDMSNSIVGSTVAGEFNIIRLAYEAGLPVPRPFVLETGTEVLGAPFIVVSRIDGHNIGDWLDATEPSREFAVDLAHALAKLHGIPPHLADNIPGSTMTVRERVEQDIRNYEETWRGSGESSIAMELALDWLKRHLHHAEGQHSIIHKDVGLHNMLAKDGRLAALLDWETAAIGHPAHDLMYARVTVVQMMPWEEFLAEYENAGGCVPSTEETDFYRLLTAVYGLHFTYLARAFLATGFSQVMTLAYAAQRIHLHYERALHEALALVMGRNER